MNKEFCTYEQALTLKELGFHEPCFGYWKMSTWLIEEKTRTDGYTHADQICSAPLYQQAFRWFREKYQLFQEIQIDQTSNPKFCFKIIKFVGNPINLSEKEWYWEEVKVVDWFLYRTYEETEQACLDKLIEIIKNKIKYE